MLLGVFSCFRLMIFRSLPNLRLFERLVMHLNVLASLVLSFAVSENGLGLIPFSVFTLRRPNGCFLGGVSMNDVNHQSRIVHIRTVLPVSYVVDFLRTEYHDDLQLAWATHDELNKALHCHVIVRFPSVKRWQRLFDWLEKPHDDGTPFDAHAYCKAAKSWTRSVRYCLHLDNPEKAVIPRAAFNSYGIDEDELAQLLAGRSSGLLDAIRIASRMAPYDAFSYLVERRGFRAGECSSGIRLLRELESLKRVRSGLSQSVVVPDDEDDEDEEDVLEDLDYAAFLDDVAPRPRPGPAPTAFCGPPAPPPPYAAPPPPYAAPSPPSAAPPPPSAAPPPPSAAPPPPPCDQ